MNFGISIGREKILKHVSVEDAKTGEPIGIYYKSFEDGVRIRFVCHYPAAISINSNSFIAKFADPTDSLTNVGSLGAGFKLGVYRDSSFTNLVLPDDKVFVGSWLYVQVSWEVESDQLQFYLADCRVSSDRTHIDVKLIKDNCYASTLGVHLLGTSHYSTNSKAQFRLVIFGQYF